MLIVHFLRNMFKLYYVDNIVCADRLHINDVVYRKELNSKENEGFIGFFDWLRVDNVTIVGIRICYFDNQSYNELLKSFPYIRPSFGGKCMELLFEGNTYDPDLSGDQDFTNNYVFKSESGDYLFTFGLDHLTDKELSSLLEYCEVLNKDGLQLDHH